MFWLIAPFLTFVAFLLLLLVSLSVPIIKPIYLFRLVAFAGSSLLDTSATGAVRFGVWGYCISAIDLRCALPSVFHPISHSNAPTLPIASFSRLVTRPQRRRI